MREPSRILVFRIGQLGDSVIAVPAIHALREQFPRASLTLLCDRQVGKNYVLGPDLFAGSGLFQDYLVYPFATKRMGRVLQPFRMMGLLALLRARRFDTIAYLAPSIRDRARIARDRRFFALAGMHRFIGFDGFAEIPPKVPGVPLPPIAHESDLLLARLAASGVRVPPAGQGDMSLGLNEADALAVDRWRKDLPSDGGRPWVGVGPGSKMPSKIWPEERWASVVRALIEAHDVWPVVVGGAEDREMGERLLLGWGRGYNAAGALGLRSAAVALGRCRLYLGSDSGAMHLAASSRTKCVAVFASRDRRGAWYPYGPDHHVLRTDIDCDGCLLFDCVERNMECIRAITPESVLAACVEALTSSGS